MQAVILAGGMGTRLYPITKTVTKPMVLVAGKPYLEHQVQFLRREGITEILFLTGYLGEQIEEHFGNGSRFGLSIKYSKERRPLGTGGALRNAAALLANTFVLLYGDSYLAICHAELLADLERTGAIAVVTVYDNAVDSTVPNNTAIDDKHRVTRYEKNGNASGLRFVDAGVLALRSEVVRYIVSPDPVSLEQEVFPQLIADGKLSAHVTNSRFYDIGTPDRLRVFENFITHDHYANAV